MSTCKKLIHNTWDINYKAKTEFYHFKYNIVFENVIDGGIQGINLILANLWLSSLVVATVIYEGYC